MSFYLVVHKDSKAGLLAKEGPFRSDFPRWQSCSTFALEQAEAHVAKYPDTRIVRCDRPAIFRWNMRRDPVWNITLVTPRRTAFDMEALTREVLHGLLVHTYFIRGGHKLAVEKTPGTRSISWSKPNGEQEVRPVSHVMSVISGLGCVLQHEAEAGKAEASH